MAKPGLPKKYAKLGFKAGWKAFKRAVASRGKKKKETSKKSSSNKSNPPAKSKKPATQKKGSRMKILSRDSIEVLKTVSVAGAGAVATNAATQIIPYVNTLSPLPKAGAQVAAGLVALKFVPGGKKVKLFVGGGFVLAGLLNAAFSFLPKFKLGGGRTFNSAEMNRLQKGYSNDGRYGMGKPVVMNKPVIMNKPVMNRARV